MKTTTLSLSFLGFAFAALGVACSAQPLPEEGANTEPTETTHEALVNNGVTECPQGDACQCRGEEECLQLAHNCRGMWYCNNDAAGGLRCMCWQNARRAPPTGTIPVGPTQISQEIQP